MRKIGILTFHASHNYGSVLQAYALSKQLALMGHQTEIINLRNEAQRKAYQIFKKSAGIRGAIQTAFTALIYPKLKKRYSKYEYFITHRLPITQKEYVSGKQLATELFDYDTYICGSDQIWNPVCQDFETAYFFDFLKNNATKIAYAPSLGKTEFDAQTLKLISSLLRNLDVISVREKRGADLLRTLIDKKVDVVCDPVVLLDKQYWDDIAVEPKLQKPYILAYFLANNHGDRRLLDYFRQKTGFEVVILNEYLRDYIKPYHRAFDAGPCEFVGLFKNAALVYTNSFHGTAFATIFNRPFYTSVAKGRSKEIANNNDSRKIDYLEKINLSKRIITDTPPEPGTILNIDYTEANRRIRDFREFSIGYLENALAAKPGA